MRRKLTYNPVRDYYLILGIDASASADAVRQAYRQRVRDVHPDLNPDRAEWATEQLKLVNEAYDVLGNLLKRREYDRLRWPHIPHQPSRQRTASQQRTSVPPTDPDRPWWEQATQRAPRGYAFSASGTADPGWERARAEAVPRPGWMLISEWLKGRGLVTLDRTWITLVGVWRSPYAPVLSVLAVVLALNVASIIYIARNPGAGDDLAAWVSGPGELATVTPLLPTIPPTPEMLAQTCADPQAKIMIPTSGDVVGDQFSVYGTVDVPDLLAYEIALGYSGTERTGIEPERWITVRPVPGNQHVPEPPVVRGELLTEDPIDLTGLPEGYYAIRLRVISRSGAVREPCDVVVLH